MKIKEKELKTIQEQQTKLNELVHNIGLLESQKHGLLHDIAKAMQPYFWYVLDFINDMKKVFPTLKDDWGIYVPEVKYLSPEPLVNYNNLSLTKYPNVHFVGDALSARGITVSGAQGTYVAEYILEN